VNDKKTLPPVGVWVDDPPKLIREAHYWDRLVEHGITTAALMIESIGHDFDPRLALPDFELIGRHCRDRDLELVLTIWPEPRVKWMGQFESRIRDFVRASGCSGIEVDTESNWLKSELVGYPSLKAAADELVRIIKQLATDYDVRSEITTYPAHQEASGSALIAGDVNRLCIQAYSVYKRKVGGIDQPVDWNSYLGPGGMQKYAYRRAKPLIDKGVKLVMGLAAYDQVWPGKTGEEAMRVAWDQSLEYDPVEIRFWSSKWIVGVKKNNYASRFLKSIRASR